MDNIYSNTGMIQRELFDRISTSSKPKLIKGFPENGLNTLDALVEMNWKLKNDFPKIAFLGMGSDGHTAGIFGEYNTEKYCYDFQNPSDPFGRVTVSMNVFLKIPRLIFLIFGKEKREMLSKVLSKQSMENYTSTEFLIRNGQGKKTIICNLQAAPDGFQIGNTEVIL